MLILSIADLCVFFLSVSSKTPPLLSYEIYVRKNSLIVSVVFYRPVNHSLTDHLQHDLVN